jgi:mRNA interferase ChpB
MKKHKIIQRGDVYWIDSNPISGREMQNKHRFIVITPREINALGIAMTIPVISGGKFTRDMGIAVSIMGHDTSGVAVCNQVRSFDIEARVKAGSAKYIETLDAIIIDDIVNRVISILDPA